MWQLHPPSPPEKSHPPLSQQPPLKFEVLSSPPPPFFKIWLKVEPPPLQKGGGYTLFDFDWDWQTEIWVINKVITYSTPRILEFKSCPVFPLWPESSRLLPWEKWYKKNLKRWAGIECYTRPLCLIFSSIFFLSSQKRVTCQFFMMT